MFPTANRPDARGSKKSIYTPAQKKLQALLRQIRIDAGLSQAELANRLGLAQPFVSKYEGGERRLDILELRRVCLAVGISLEEFVRRLEDMLEQDYGE